MENNIRIENLRGCFVSYYHKIDGSIYHSGVPQYHKVVRVKRGYDWETVYNNACNIYNYKIADEIRDFLRRFGQLKREPNGYGNVNYCDVEGSMYVSSEILENYLKEKLNKGE